MLRQIGRRLAPSEERLLFGLAVELRVDDAIRNRLDVDVEVVVRGNTNRRGAVLAELELDDSARGIPDGAVVLGFEFRQGVDQATLEVARFRGSDCRVDQPLAATHRVEEEFSG